jgi:uncharacterized protein
MKKHAWILLLGLTAVLAGAPGPVRAQFSVTYDFLKAVEKNDYAEARNNLFKGANINGRKDGEPALVLALRNHNYEMMQFLIDNGAYVNNTTLGTNPQTTLMLAAVSGDAQAIGLLLAAKADPNAIDRQGQTALMKAAVNRRTDAVRMLIAGRADIFQTDFTGRSAKQYAREARAMNIIHFLEEAGDN